MFDFLKKKKKGELTASIKTSGGIITASSKEFTTEFHEVSEKENPNLVHLFSCGNDNFWLKILDEYELWRSTYNPQIHKQTHWIQYEEHDIQNLLAFGILHNRDYHNPFPKNVWLNKRILRRMSKILKKIKIKESRKEN